MPLSAATQSHVGASGAALDRIAAVARQLLSEMLDARRGLFSHKTVLVGNAYRNIGSNPLYTGAAAIGLLADEPSATVPDACLDAIWISARASRDAALVGLSLWALARAADDRAARLLAYSCSLSIRRANSMGLGLLLAGASAAAEGAPQARDPARALVSECRDELRSRFVPAARVFRGRARSVSREHLLHSGLTSFASQVYPLHGLAAAARAFDEPVLDECRACSAHLVELQGPLGQWWWFYSTERPCVIEGYPVYSVHQDAMAYMALAPLHRLGVEDFAEPLWRGITWLHGDNELKRPLVVSEPAFIFRAIQRRGSHPDRYGGISARNRWKLVMASHGLLSPPATRARPDELEVLEECRPYHLGWLLYARRLARECGL